MRLLCLRAYRELPARSPLPSYHEYSTWLYDLCACFPIPTTPNYYEIQTEQIGHVSRPRIFPFFSCKASFVILSAVLC
jgi:hypothetical protein